jgi:peroxiredoxin
LQAQTSAVSEHQTTAIPSSAEAVTPLKVGKKIPAVNLNTPEGDSFNLNAFVKEQPVVLIFYRGGWCPYGNVQLQELMEADPQLRAMGYRILAVSPDTPEKLAESMEEHEMPYTLLSDRNMEAAKAFGVAYQIAESTAKKHQASGIELASGSDEEQHLLPVPSVFIIDQEGSIRYAYYNPDYKTRLKVEDLLQEAKKAL